MRGDDIVRVEGQKGFMTPASLRQWPPSNFRSFCVRGDAGNIDGGNVQVPDEMLVTSVTARLIVS